MKKITGPRCLTTQTGNILAFIPAGEIPQDLAVFIKGDQWIYVEGKKMTWLKHPKVEIQMGKPINQTEWSFLLGKAGETLRSLTTQEVASVLQAILVRATNLKKVELNATNTKRFKSLKKIPA
jgi:hypothetical protein